MAGDNGKRIRAAREGINRTKLYPLTEAVKLVKDRAKAKFDETVEVAMNLGVDPRHADQMVRGVCNLPNGSGRTVRVAVFARGGKADEAHAAGADVVGAEDLVERVQGGNDRLRPLHRHPGHDAARRPSRQGSGPARPDAEPEGRHGDDGRRRRRSRPPRAARSSSASRRPASCTAASARPRSTTRSSSRTSRRFRRCGRQGQAGGRQGHLHAARRDLLDHGAGRQGRSGDACSAATAVGSFRLRFATARRPCAECPESHLLANGLRSL